MIRANASTLEMLMFPRQDSNIENYIFSHAMYKRYESPPNFEFDTKTQHKTVTKDNVKQMSQEFMAYFRG